MYNELIKEENPLLEKFQPSLNIQHRLQEKVYPIDLSYFTACLVCIYIAIILVIKYKIMSEKCTDSEDGQEVKDENFVYNIESCPICLGSLRVPVRIRCGHAYCVTCLSMFLKYVKKGGKCECPLCKSPVKNATLIQMDSFCITRKDKANLEKQLKKMIDKAKFVYSRRTIYLVNLSIGYLFICIMFLYFIFATNIFFM